MEEFIDYAKVIMGTLGHKLFEPVNKPIASSSQTAADETDNDTIKLHLERTIKNVGKVEANGAQTSEGFVVLQGSRISPIDDDMEVFRRNAQPHIADMRKGGAKQICVWGPRRIACHFTICESSMSIVTTKLASLSL